MASLTWRRPAARAASAGSSPLSTISSIFLAVVAMASPSYPGHDEPMALPVRPPVPPMLAKLQPELPRGDGWLYEPKWDGFRAIVFRDGADVYIQSRDSRPFNRYFPELPPVFKDRLAKTCVV